MKTYNIGIIGYGAFGKFLHHWWNQLENIEVIAVADAKLDDGELGKCKVYRNGLDLINNRDIDIVSIVTPPALHAGMACAAMRAGKHVLLEKPVAITNEEAAQIREVQQETGKVILVNHMLRYNPLMKLFRQLSSDGIFGPLRHAVVNNYAQDAGLPPEHWFWDRKLSGGIFVEHAVHFFDIINSFTDQNFKQVLGGWHDRNERQRDQVSASIFYDGGLIASHYHSFSGPGFFERTTINLNYDLAKVEIEGWIPMKGKIQALVTAEGSDRLAELPGWQAEKIAPIDSIEDISRPTGWGDVSKNVRVSAGGIQYEVTDMVSGTFEIKQTKGEVYGKCVQEIIEDMIAKIEDSSHRTAVTFEDACRSLEIAVMASKGINQSSDPTTPTTLLA